MGLGPTLWRNRKQIQVGIRQVLGEIWPCESQIILEDNHEDEIHGYQKSSSMQIYPGQLDFLLVLTHDARVNESCNMRNQGVHNSIHR